jgi:hypothetical protein
MPVLMAECEKQTSQPGTVNLIDPTGQNVTDQSVSAHPESSPPPARPTPDGELMKKRP